jgi:diaminopimelate decarboxylase
VKRALSSRAPGFFWKRLRSGAAAFHCEGLALSALARKFGTPLYVYSARAIRESFIAFDHAFRSVPHTICYAVKANSNLHILRLLADLGCGFDIVSVGELERVRRIGRAALRQTVFSGVGKTTAELEAALRARILVFNCESEFELANLAAIARRLRRVAPVALRVNPDVHVATHPYISTGMQEHKFGVPVSEARRIYRRIAREKYLDAIGISVHIGSQITSPEPFKLALERVAELIRELRGDDHNIRFLDAGGGLGIPYQQGDNPDLNQCFGEYATAVSTAVSGLNIHLLLEPGRALVGHAGTLLTSVLGVKQNGKKRFAIADAAMNDLLRPALYGAYHEIVPVSASPNDRKVIFDIVGPVCETGDFLARDRRLAEPESGDLLAVLDTGAYGMSLASNYNSRPRPAEVLVEGHAAKLIRRREKIEDLLRLEQST